jgi:hypothetical protein
LTFSRTFLGLFLHASWQNLKKNNKLYVALS